MTGNSTGYLFTLTTFGESHGSAVGGIIDGCPPHIAIDETFIQNQLNRRRPGQSSITSPRNEVDKVELLSGVFEGKSTGTPIGFMVRNGDQHSADYDNIMHIYRPSHADYTYDKKYGIRDHRGGGRSSARETISRVVAGAIAQLILKQYNISIHAYTSSVGPIILDKPYTELDLSTIDDSIVRCPDTVIANKMIEFIHEVQKEGDSVGGQITCVVQGVPAGLGEPVFGKLHAELGKAMLSINAVKGFEYGSGFAGSSMRGSEHNDPFYINNEGGIRTRGNYSGGIQGGISNGEDIYFKIALKPVATLLRTQTTVTKNHEEVSSKTQGRHDPCVLPRAVPIVEAMTALVLVDALLLQLKNKME